MVQDEVVARRARPGQGRTTPRGHSRESVSARESWKVDAASRLVRANPPPAAKSNVAGTNREKPSSSPRRVSDQSEPGRASMSQCAHCGTTILFGGVQDEGRRFCNASCHEA